MPRRASRASGVADHQPAAAPVRAYFDVSQLVHHAGEIVTSWRLWRAWPRADAVEILLDSLIEFERAINPERLRFEEWQAGGSVAYSGSRAAGVAICGMGEAFFEIVGRLGLTGIIGGHGIVDGTLDATQLRAVENAVDSLARLVEILRAAPAVSGEVAPAELQAVESIGQCDPYTSLKKFASDSLRGKEQKFLRLVIRSMEMEPTIGLRFASLSEFFNDPDFDAEKFGKNKIAILNEKLKRNRMNYRLTQKASAAILREIPAKA